MPITTVKVKTWICPNSPCPFRWQFSGDALSSTPYDLSADQLTQQFPEVQFAGLQAGKCPNCYLQGIDSPLGLSVDSAEMSEVVPATDAELEAQEVEELDEQGNPIMEESGEVRYQFDPMTGQVTPVPVMVPMMRSLTTQELAELKEQRDRNLDALESIAVKEV